jgi:hypothetical protein
VGSLFGRYNRLHTQILSSNLRYNEVANLENTNIWRDIVTAKQSIVRNQDLQRPVAIFNLETLHQSNRFATVSGQEIRPGPFRNLDINSNRRYEPIQVEVGGSGNFRDAGYDAEAKGVEMIASIVDSRTRGRLDVYVEKPPCPSCRGILSTFAQEHPNLSIRVTFVPDRRPSEIRDFWRNYLGR